MDLTATPDPSTAVASQGVTYTITGDTPTPTRSAPTPGTTSFVVNIQETGGTALEITSVNLRVQQAAGGIVIAPSGGEVEHYQFNSSASGNRCPPTATPRWASRSGTTFPTRDGRPSSTVTLGFKEVNKGDDGT